MPKMFHVQILYNTLTNTDIFDSIKLVRKCEFERN